MNSAPWSASPSARRINQMCLVRFDSSTKPRGQTPWMSSSLLTRRPARSTKKTKVSKTFGVSTIDSPARSKRRSSGSSSKSRNEKVDLVDADISRGRPEPSATNLPEKYQGNGRDKYVQYRKTRSIVGWVARDSAFRIPHERIKRHGNNTDDPTRKRAGKILLLRSARCLDNRIRRLCAKLFPKRAFWHTAPLPVAAFPWFHHDFVVCSLCHAVVAHRNTSNPLASPPRDIRSVTGDDNSHCWCGRGHNQRPRRPCTTRRPDTGGHVSFLCKPNGVRGPGGRRHL